MELTYHGIPIGVQREFEDESSIDPKSYTPTVLTCDKGPNIRLPYIRPRTHRRNTNKRRRRLIAKLEWQHIKRTFKM